MKRKSQPARSSASEAQLAANRANAKLSTGPKTVAGKQNSSQNSRRHGLTCRTAWLGEDKLQSEKFFSSQWLRIRPRNVVEEIHTGSLLRNREREKFLLAAELTILTRKPVPLSLNQSEFPFLLDPEALRTLDLLARQVSHSNRIAVRDFKSLLQARKITSEKSKQTTHTTNHQNNLMEFLQSRGPLTDGEDLFTYTSIAREFWLAYEPTNSLETFLVGDIIIVQHQLDRVQKIQSFFLSSSAISATGHDGGFGFGFVHDCQRTQAFETLRNYEDALQKRLNSRMQLFQKVREAAWTDSANPDPDLSNCPHNTTASISAPPIDETLPGNQLEQRVLASDPAPPTIVADILPTNVENQRTITDTACRPSIDTGTSDFPQKTSM